MPEPKKPKALRTGKKNSKKKASPKRKKPNPGDGIAKSKQLVQKLQTSKSFSRVSKSRGKNNDEVRLCGNGKPMPSLAELEKMFGDSDGDDEPKDNTSRPPTLQTPLKLTKPTPEIPAELLSPKTIEKIANKMLDFVTNLTEPPALLDDDGPPPPIIKPKKRKPTEIPYIVGCTDRPYVPRRPNLSVFQGDDKYGAEHNEGESDDDIPKKRAKRSKKVNISKSTFNAMSDEIAARLKKNDDGCDNSNEIVAYVAYNPNTSTPSFCPLPSTSKDKETFVKNDQLFNESFASENKTKTYTNEDIDDLEILETPYETIVINDSLTNYTKPTPLEESSLIEILDDGSVDVFKDNETRKDSSKDVDDSVQVIDVKPSSPIAVEDYYSSLNTSSSGFDYSCEIIDIDDVIAESTAVVEKYCKNKHFNKVTMVDVTEVNDNNTISSNNNANVEKRTQAMYANKTTHKATECNVLTNSNDKDNVIVQNVVLVNSSEAEMQRPYSDNNDHPSDNGLTLLSQDFNDVIDGGEIGTGSNRNNLQIPQPGQVVTEQRHNHTSPYRRNRQGSHRKIRGGIRYRPSYSRISASLRNCASLIDWCSLRGSDVSQATVSSVHGVDALRSASKENNNIQTSPVAIQNQNVGQQEKTSTETTSKGIGDCAICMDTMSNKSVASTMCGHLFCMDCIKLSIKSNGKKCPTCRKVLKPAPGYHQIFL